MTIAPSALAGLAVLFSMQPNTVPAAESNEARAPEELPGCPYVRVVYGVALKLPKLPHIDE